MLIHKYNPIISFSGFFIIQPFQVILSFLPFAVSIGFCVARSKGFSRSRRCLKWCRRPIKNNNYYY